jgi:spore coat protein YsxE
MEMDQKIFAAYHIYPLHIEQITENMHKVSDGNKDYALKRSSLKNEQEAEVWKHVYEQANHHNLQSILPVYLTGEGKLYTIQNQNIYYLSPWLEAANVEKDKKTLEQFYHTIGQIHAKTRQVQTVDTSAFLPGFKEYASYCSNIQQSLLAYVEHFEKNRYMSPFELSVCTHFRDLDFSLMEIKRRLEQLMEIEDNTIPWNISLCHSNLQFSHMLRTRQLHLINWEKSRYDNAAMDLAAFFKNEMKKFDAPTEDAIDLFNNYMKENELTKSELYLLSIYLLDPAPYITLVEEYAKRKSGKPLIEQTKMLEEAYRLIIFGIKWSNFIEKEYETLDLDDLDS